MRFLLRILLSITVIVSLIWFARTPGFESMMSILTSLIALLTFSTTAIASRESHSSFSPGHVLFGTIAGSAGGAIFGSIIGLTAQKAQVADLISMALLGGSTIELLINALLPLALSATFGACAGWFSAEGIAPDSTLTKGLGGLIGMVVGVFIGYRLTYPISSVVEWAAVWAIIYGLTGAWYSIREDAIFAGV